MALPATKWRSCMLPYTVVVHNYPPLYALLCMRARVNPVQAMRASIRAQWGECPRYTDPMDADGRQSELALPFQARSSRHDRSDTRPVSSPPTVPASYSARQETTSVDHPPVLSRMPHAGAIGKEVQAFVREPQLKKVPCGLPYLDLTGARWSVQRGVVFGGAASWPTQFLRCRSRAADVPTS